MTRHSRTKRPVLLWILLALLMAGVLLWALSGRQAPPGPIPTVQPPTPTRSESEDRHFGNDRAEVDLTDLEQGVAQVRYLSGEARMKVQIAKADGKNYNYDLHSPGVFETFPFTEGEGTYTLKVLEHREGSTYAPVYTLELEVTLEGEMAPFLRPNQFVSYGQTVADLAAQVMELGATDADKTALAFDHVVDHLTYDFDKADTVGPGYLPDLEAILAEEKGICFDYAALLCAMLRSQGIPCKLQVGDSGDLYHAWVEVRCGTEGLVDDTIPITAGAWTRLDPTFVSSDERSQFILSYVTDDSNYQVQYTY